MKSIPQDTVAFEIGITERRLRDIEHGRARPRRKTREEILRLAESLRAGAEPNRDGSIPDGWSSLNSLLTSSDSGYAGASEQPSLFWSILFVAIVVGGVIALIYFASSRPIE